MMKTHQLLAIPVLIIALAHAVCNAQRADDEARRSNSISDPGQMRLAAIPDQVVLVAPANGSTAAGDSVRFTWMAATGATSYDVSFSFTQDFVAHLDSNRIARTSMTLHGVPASRTLYWRVRATDASGSGSWSTIWSVTTGSSGGGGGTGVPDSVKPLTELGTGLYRGYPGGLYPGGSNVPPPAHLAAGLAIARTIVPLSSAGLPDPANGSIVLLSIGMSNATQEYSVFKTLADTFAARNPRLVVVDGAQGGQTASIIADTSAAFWGVIDGRLAAAGVTARQVEAVWLKEANAGPTTGFPQYATDLQANLQTIVRYLAVRYPNLRIVYLASRIYGGYATTTLNPEMYAYESGFSVKWLIERQIAGDTALAYAGPARRAPWLAWGPYLWANGTHPRRDGLVWEAADLGPDGTHPSDAGRLKVARMLLDFLRSDTTSAGWFLRGSGGAGVEADAPHAVMLACRPNPATDRFAITVTLAVEGNVRLELFDALGRKAADLLSGPLEAGPHALAFSMHEEPLTGLASGTYYCHLTAGAESAMERLIIVR